MKKDTELEELIDQVLRRGKSRVINTIDAKTYLNSAQKQSSAASENTQMEALLDNLSRQKEELKEMSKKNLGFSEEDYQRLEAEIMKDFGALPKKAEPLEERIQNLSDYRAHFKGVEEALGDVVLGQRDYLHQLTLAFERPFVMGTEPSMPKNSMLLSGPADTGKRLSLTTIAGLLKTRDVLSSDEVLFMNLALYPGKDQETIFLQDLYKNLKNPAEILCFENVEQCFQPFLEILSELAFKGSTQLSKRYTANAQGQLQEAGSGLLKQSVSTLSAEGKYLIFLTDGTAAKQFEVLGTGLMKAVRDRFSTAPLDSPRLLEILNRQLSKLLEKAESQLKIKLEIEESGRQYLFDTAEKNGGAGGILQNIELLYEALGEIRMNDLGEKELKVTLKFENEALLEIDGRPTRLDQWLKQEAQLDLAEIKQELDEIVGLTDIKKYVLSLEDHYKVQQLRKAQGLKTTELSMHMIFTGNPGTGKTTIARLISRLLKAIGVLSNGQLVEVTRADLVGRYVGHTAPQTLQMIKSALGGVLFIDEAYSLYRGKEDSFGLEAIDTLVKGMEDYRSDLIVILAGYSKEMEEFLQANSGLKSRFPNMIEFPDYTAEELCAIAKSVAKGKEYRIDENALSALYDYFERIQSEAAKSAGNGRLARNTVEAAILNQASRVLKNPDQPLDLLILEDFELNS